MYDMTNMINWMFDQLRNIATWTFVTLDRIFIGPLSLLDLMFSITIIGIVIDILFNSMKRTGIEIGKETKKKK